LPRWIELAVSGTLMVYIIALLCGYSDWATLKLMGVAIVATAALGWLAEQQNATSRKPVWSAYVISIFTGVMPWLALGSALLTTILLGDVRSPWYVYALAGTTLVSFGLAAWNQWKQYLKQGSWADYAMVERNYALIGTLAKTAFAIILIVGLAK
jgi:hypothetical protein